MGNRAACHSPGVGPFAAAARLRRVLAAVGLLLALGAAVSPARAAAPDFYDLFCDDASSATTNQLVVNLPQYHEFSDAGDADWATFVPVPGLPYRIIVCDVAPGVDPILTVYPEGPGGAAIKVDDYVAGEGESFWRVAWPWSGRCWIRVTTDGIGTGATTYTLVAALEIGPNVGLASISGTGGNNARPDGGTLSLSDGENHTHLASVDTSSTLYTRSYLRYPAGAFSAGGDTYLVIAGVSNNAKTRLDSPWLVAWHARFPTNFSLTHVSILPAEGALLKPVQVCIQMRGQGISEGLYDGDLVWPDVLLQDVPTGASPSSVAVFRWQASTKEWLLYDRHPEVVEDGADWMVTTTLTDYQPDVFGTEVFAAAVVTERNAARDWLHYR